MIAALPKTQRFVNPASRRPGTRPPHDVELNPDAAPSAASSSTHKDSSHVCRYWNHRSGRGAVARALLAAKLMVRAVVRDDAKGAPWAARGCDIAIAELTDVAAMTAAFSGVDGVFILMPSNFDPEPGFPDSVRIDAAVHAALTAAKPRKVVRLSTIGAQATQPNLLNRLGLMEQTLGTLPMPVAFLRAGWFMENSKWDIAPARDTGSSAASCSRSTNLYRWLPPLTWELWPPRCFRRTGLDARWSNSKDLAASPPTRSL